MDALERCKEAIWSYEEDEFGESQPLETFETPWSVGIAYTQFQSEYGDASDLEMADEQWTVDLENNVVELCIDCETQILYEFNNQDELADWLEENLDFDYLIGIADEWCRQHEEVTK